MRTTGALLFSHRGLALFLIIITGTHTLLRRLITAGDFLPPQGPRMKGAKTQSSDTTHIGLYT